MSSIFFALNTANTALQSDQIAIDTVDHNVSNANTPGYTEQTANLATTPPFTVPSMIRPQEPGQIGSGVQVQSITRSRDALLDTQYRYENQIAGQWSTLDTQYQQIQNILTEPSQTGLNEALSNFWSNWQSLADNPTNTGARATVQQSGVALATTFNSDAQQLSEAQQSADTLASNAVKNINSAATQIANLNGQIAAVLATGQQPNDLMDQRDQLIDQISNLVPIIATTQSNGSVTIQIATQVPNSSTLQVADPTAAALVSGTSTNLLAITAMGQPAYASTAAGTETVSLAGNFAGPATNNYMVKVAAVSAGAVTQYEYSTDGGQTYSAPVAVGTAIGGSDITPSFTGGTPQVGDAYAFTVGAVGSNSASYTVTKEFGATATMSLAGTFNGPVSTTYILTVLSLAGSNVATYAYSTDGGQTFSAPIAAGSSIGWSGITPAFTSGASVGDRFSFNAGAVNSNSASYAVSGAPLVNPPQLVPVDATSVPLGGQLGAALQLRDTIIGGSSGLIAQLNTISQAVVQAVNAQHAQGYDATGTLTGKPFFSAGSTTAANMAVDPNIAANSQNIAASTSGAAGDGSNAQAIANISSLVGAAGSPLPNQTITQGVQTMIATMGANAQQAKGFDQNQTTVMNSLTNQRQSVGGVSLDEQMTHLIQFQYAYESAAHIVTTIDTLLDTIINHMGLTA
jgi:flagellar hook-associated protein 1 FlgK